MLIYLKAPGPHASADRALFVNAGKIYWRSTVVAVLAVTGAAADLAEV
jgi:hypothetical protein